jgi:hypothetical protein
MGKDEETEIIIHGLTSDFLRTYGIKRRSGATSLFDVQRWTFDVRSSVYSTCPQCLEASVSPIQPYDLYIHVCTNPTDYAWQAGVHLLKQVCPA